MNDRHYYPLRSAVGGPTEDELTIDRLTRRAEYAEASARAWMEKALDLADAIDGAIGRMARANALIERSAGLFQEGSHGETWLAGAAGTLDAAAALARRARESEL